MLDTSHVHQLPTNSLQPNPLQPRGVIQPETIMDLVDSISEHGIIEPLVLAHTPAGYQIIAGERRWRAAKMAGLETVPCIIKETTPRGMLEMAIVENVQREDLNPVERANAFQRLQAEFELSFTEVAKRIGKSPSYVSNTIRLLDLPDAVKDGLLSGQITEGHARALQAITNRPAMIEAYKTILKESASVRRAEEIARRVKTQLQDQGIQKPQRSHHVKLVHERLDKIQQEIYDSLKRMGGRTKVQLIQTIHQTRVILTLDGPPQEVESRLQKIYKGLASDGVKPDLEQAVAVETNAN